MGRHKPRGLSLADAFAWYDLIEQPAPFPDLEGPCLLWPASKTHGHGQMWWGGRPLYAHVVAYELVNGPVPEGLEVDHRCLVRACVQEPHLRAVPRKTNAENIRRLKSTGTGFKGVYRTASGRFYGQVGHHGKQLHVGVFDTPEEAHVACQARRQELYGPEFIER